MLSLEYQWICPVKRQINIWSSVLFNRTILINPSHVYLCPYTLLLLIPSCGTPVKIAGIIHILKLYQKSPLHRFQSMLECLNMGVRMIETVYQNHFETVSFFSQKYIKGYDLSQSVFFRQSQILKSLWKCLNNVLKVYQNTTSYWMEYFEKLFHEKFAVSGKSHSINASWFWTSKNAFCQKGEKRQI